MIDTASFSKLVPGFDFLEKMMRGAGQATPGMGQWIAPTLDPAELEKRIGELKTVLFWLEQNSRMLSATIQAMEVQRMTLNTLQTMNLPLAELQKAMLLPTLPAAAAAVSPAAPAAAAAKPQDPPDAANAPAGKPKPVDPMLWWSALTQQFGELAAKAVQDSSAGITQLAKSLPKSAAGKVAATTADATSAPKRPARAAAKAAAKTIARKAR
jgi:hypothetical protein